MDIIQTPMGYAEYMKNVRQSWMKEDVLQAQKTATSLLNTWMGIACGMDGDESIEFQEIARGIKILIEQIEEYEDKRCKP